MIKFSLLIISFGCAISAYAQKDFTMLSSPEGGPCIKMAQADNGNLYLLSRGGTLYSSTNHGESWLQLICKGTAFVDFALLENKILAIDNHNVYTSTDEGKTFSRTWYFESTWLKFIRTLPNKKMLLFGEDMINSTDYPLYISSDAGLNWTLSNPNITSILPGYGFGFQSVFIAPDGKIFVPTFFDEIVSSDEGLTFTVSRSYMYQFSKMAFDATSIYSLTFVDFVRSDDHGQNWTNIKNGLPGIFFGGLIATTDSHEIIWINPSLVSQQVYISSDGGDHWSLQGELPNLGEEFFNVYSYQNELFLLGSSGVYSSLDKGVTWSKKNSGINAQEYKDILLVNSNFFLVTEPSLYSKKYTKANWSQTQLPSVFQNLNFPIYLKDITSYNSANLILYGGNNFDFASSDKGNSWIALKGNEAGGGNYVSTIVEHDTVFSAVQDYQEINKRLPGSTTWDPIATSWLNSNLGVNTMVETSDNHILVSYSNSSGNRMLAKVSRSFQLISQIPWNPDFQLMRVGSKIFDLSNDQLLVSNNNGDSWNEVLSWPWDNSSKLFTDNKGRLFVGTNGKFQISLDTAKTWTSFTLDDSPKRSVSGITTDSLGHIYVAVNNKGIFKSNFRLGVKAQMINFTTLSPKIFGDPTFTLDATTSSGLPLTYSSSDTLIAKVNGNVVTIFGAGSTVITASQSGNTFYDSAGVQQTLSVGKAMQQIQFTTPLSKTLGDPSFVLHAQANSKLPISFSSSNVAIVSINDSTAVISSAGSVSLTATQSGNSNYNPVSKTITFCISPAVPIISMDKASNNIKTILTSSSSKGNQWFLNDAKLVDSTSQTISVTQAGFYSLIVTIDTCSSQPSAPLEIKIITGDLPITSDFRIYPDPTEGDLNINYSTTQHFTTFAVDVIDLQGRTILSHFDGVDNMKLDVSMLSPSMYFLRLTDADQVKILKFIKK